MRFLVGLLSLMCVGTGPSSVYGDLRAASQPREQFKVVQRNPVQFVNKTVIYMEPSAFNYQGLAQQRQDAYDNFLRSNIDNEQDKRNFNNEAGRDMLPFRSYEGASTDASGTVQTKIPNNAPGPVLTVTPGQETLYPLRWNNPHASELEVNIWITNLPANVGPVVVPIRKPTCSGEGHQDNVFAFIVPNNFNSLGNVIPGFTGCKNKGDCVLQIYAHSVEPRTYAIGVPLVVTGTVSPLPATATDTNGIQPAQQDVGLDLSKLTRDICLSSADASADITVAVPRRPRLVSDVFNHAYQNSDYSPYSGQQPEAISRNLQASAIISMIPGNRGELGQALLQQQSAQTAQFAANLRNKVNNLVQRYEGLTNKIIAEIGDKVMKSTATEGTNGIQKLATCFRCAETGSSTTTRQTTSTYVPSFQLPAAQIAAANKLVPAQYNGLISDTGIVGIYQAVLDDMSVEFTRAAALGLLYQPAMIKSSLTTMNDQTQFRKKNAQGQNDNGLYAAQRVATAQLASASAVTQNIAATTEPGTWNAHKGFDTYPGQNVDTLPTSSATAAQIYGAARNFVGFVHCGNTAYYRSASVSPGLTAQSLFDRKVPNGGCTLYINTAPGAGTTTGTSAQLKPLSSYLSDDTAALPSIGTSSTVSMRDLHGINADTKCDNDAYALTPECTLCTDEITTNCVDTLPEPQPLFAKAADGSGLTTGNTEANSAQHSHITITTTIVTAIVAGAAAVVANAY